MRGRVCPTFTRSLLLPVQYLFVVDSKIPAAADTELRDFAGYGMMEASHQMLSRAMPLK